MRIYLLTLIYAFLICGPASATDKDSDIETNRPSITFSPIVIPKGSLQLENGTTNQWFDGAIRFDIPENQIRLGLLEKTELQMFTPNFVLDTAGGHTNTGATDLGEVGIKQQLPRFKNILGSAIVSVNCPSGGSRRFLTGPGWQPVFRLPLSMPVGQHYQVCAMPSFLLLNSGRTPQYQQTVMLCRGIGRKAGIFAEYGGFFTRGFPDVNIAHFGGTYKITAHNQFDLHFGFGMNRTAPTAFIGGGYSVRFDNLNPFKK